MPKASVQICLPVAMFISGSRCFPKVKARLRYREARRDYTIVAILGQDESFPEIR